MRISRRFTDGNSSPYAKIKFRQASSEIRNPDGSVVFKLDNIDVPSEWSQVACDIIAQKYFRKAGVPLKNEHNEPLLDENGKVITGSETSIKQVAHRIY